MPICKVGNININYEVYGSGFPLVLSHAFAANLKMWRPQIKKLSSKYRVILYDIRGFGLSSAPAGKQNYSLEILVKDLHSLITHLDIDKAYIGGLSLGGAISLGYAYRYPEVVAALLILDIHGGFQPRNTESESSFAELWKEEERIALQRGIADLARYQIATGTAFPPIVADKSLQEQYIKEMASCPINGFIGVGRALPWEAEWQRKAADKIHVPTLITVGSDDKIKQGVRILHEHIRGSRYVEIRGSAHGTARWHPDAINKSIMEFLEAVEQGEAIEGEIILD